MIFTQLVEELRLEAKRKKTLRSLERTPRWAKNRDKLRRRYQGQARMAGAGEVDARKFANRAADTATGHAPEKRAGNDGDVRSLRRGLKGEAKKIPLRGRTEKTVTGMTRDELKKLKNRGFFSGKKASKTMRPRLLVDLTTKDKDPEDRG